MLEQLFGSKTRVKLLRIFLNNPDKIYYVRELARAADTQINSVRRELANLEKMGIINLATANKEPAVKSGKPAPKNKKKNRKKYYQAKESFLLFSDLRALLLKARMLLEKNFAGKLERGGHFHFLLLTGVFTGAAEADTDILMVGKINHNKIKKLIKNFEKDLNREINYTIMDKDEFEYRMDVTDRFLYNILDNDNIILIDKRM